MSIPVLPLKRLSFSIVCLGMVKLNYLIYVTVDDFPNPSNFDYLLILKNLSKKHSESDVL